MKLSDHLDKLRAFQAIVDCGTVREAAARLHVTQPGLTRAVQTLEEAAGVSLFHRSRAGMTVTRAGSLLAEFAELTLKNLADLEARLRSPENAEAGMLRVGSYESLAEYLWPEFVVSFRVAAPGLKLLIRTSASARHQQSLSAGELDIVVDAEPRPRADFTTWILYQDRFGFFARRESDFASLGPATTQGVPLLYCPSAFDKDHKSLIQHVEAQGYDFSEKMELDSFTAARTFAEAGAGLAILPFRLAERSLANKALEQVRPPGFAQRGFGSHRLCATIRSDRVDDPRLKLLIRRLRAHFRE